MSARVYSPGDHLDRFEVVSVLGDGGSATVYRVRHLLLGSEYALKLVAAPSGEDRERLLREGRAQSMLRHRNIVPVLDAVSIGDDLGLVLELVDGPDLARWLEGHRPDLATLDRMAHDLFDGLALAHAHGFIHRDLKPSNVLIANPDGETLARIVDFGLAKDFTDVSPGLTQSTWIFGTPAYAAPEQAAGARSVDIRADVFSLGAVLYEIATGHRAFPGKNILDVMQAAADEAYVDPRELRPDLPARMGIALQAALRADPEARAPDVATLRTLWSCAEAPGVNPVVEAPRKAPPTASPSTALPVSTAARAPTPALVLGVLAAIVLIGAGLQASWWSSPDRGAPVAVSVAPTPSSLTTPPLVPTAADAAPPAPPPGAMPPAASAPAASATKARAPSAAHAPTQPAIAPALRVAPPSASTPELPPPAPPEVRVEGDVSEVVLFDARGQRVSAGALHAGTYVIEARFRADEPRVIAARLELRAGDVVEVTCSAGLRRCAPRKLNPSEGP